MPPEPVVLAFDTSAAHCAAAVVCGSRILAQRAEAMEKGQAERLMPLLAGVLAEAQVGYAGLSAIGVGTGPGNFTGVRISVAAARGLALGLGIPAIGITGFEALAAGLPDDVVTLLDARRGALWLAGRGIVPQLADPPDLPDRIRGRPLVGYRAEELALHTGGVAHRQPVPMAVAIARLAAARLGRPHPRPAPMYLRAADAALPAGPPPVILP
ncbi:MAG: tRNA (adenosine(37)-N6)-threonylcarbamoyltransferase complex dimerization subunit type 1 TsaB [Rhodobacter sp.]|nr:tRNA (adenosine(37)-N6)-threonylcarbamoyltransferase complex dimerization subunit type 1 TsaB [Rhodobacter sp.]MCA3521231.1 tRNA (adenosine(37)-N6)-threonylcarbamoyltransferase complex dimerization subunit type 1 TsaB [Rhodobacter sp.]MCA3523810.1 tRNA (adenosine(37)-N6)-threonylcarbamoyltransferase complex dimerization subunit type 1 TsaB [Rhodobacter sp.]MCA3526264.1 tRNA (adenosine(37)-N6)-threonylcarbamoyltransferase complex dimerization subunit type 1 TsaB [Rhodobacter sp.]MCA3529058.1 